MPAELKTQRPIQELAPWVSAALLPGASPVPVIVLGPLRVSAPVMELECAVFLQGQQSGVLLLRADRSLALMLSDAAMAYHGARHSPRQAFAELTERLAQVLLQAGLFGQPPQASAKPAQDLREWNWPPSRPNRSGRLLVGGHVMEFQLWTEAADTV
jgi:hypothetical protein